MQANYLSDRATERERECEREPCASTTPLCFFSTKNGYSRATARFLKRVYLTMCTFPDKGWSIRLRQDRAGQCQVARKAMHKIQQYHRTANSWRACQNEEYRTLREAASGVEWMTGARRERSVHLLIATQWSSQVTGSRVPGTSAPMVPGPRYGHPVRARVYRAPWGLHAVALFFFHPVLCGWAAAGERMLKIIDSRTGSPRSRPPPQGISGTLAIGYGRVLSGCVVL